MQQQYMNYNELHALYMQGFMKVKKRTPLGRKQPQRPRVIDQCLTSDLIFERRLFPSTRKLQDS